MSRQIALLCKYTNIIRCTVHTPVKFNFILIFLFFQQYVGSACDHHY